MSKKKKIILGISTVLFVLAIAIFIVPWFIWRNGAEEEGRKENQKYGLETSAESVTSTGMTIIVECQGKKRSLQIVEIFYLEKATIWGWKDVKRLDKPYGINADYKGLGNKTTWEFTIDLESLYGKLSKGTYRARLPILSDDNERVAWCYTTFEIKE